MEILKAGVLYFALVFGAGLVLGPLRILWVVPRFGTSMAELMEAPIMFLVIIVAARWQPRRNKKAAKKFFRKLLKGLQYVPHAIITDKLRGYAEPRVEHQQQGRLNNRAENSHQPTRERERRMRGFKSPGHAQRFLSIFGVIASFFRPGRHLLAAKNYREIMRRRFTQWREIVGLQPAI